DVRMIGIDLSDEMIRIGRESIRECGLADRVELRTGDIRKVGTLSLPPVDAINSIYTLHHLPLLEDLRACIAGIACLRRRTGCAVWVFDHCLPRNPLTAEAFPKIATPDAPTEFQNDSSNSLKASFPYDVLSSEFDDADIGRFSHVRSRLLRVFQAHWLEPAPGPAPSCAGLWQNLHIPAEILRQTRMLRHLFPTLPISADRMAN
ncbi:MAG: hypothetical protein C0404_12865, partial [Verrucomicrobia bacterium]|nr:hypothetical protein [Verrucomicrobiota bacterium]